MNQATWSVAADGRYWLDFQLGSLVVSLLVDTGLVDPQDRVGMEVEPAIFDQLRQAGQLTQLHDRTRCDASGQLARRAVGQVTAQLLHPQTRQLIGPAVPLDVLRCFPSVPNRVGVSFFHHLQSCQVVWNLTNRTWCVEWP
jgi:hypothetical protein